MTGESKLAKALRAYLDLEGSSEQLLETWNRASEEERRDCLDSLLHESLLLDALSAADAGDQQTTDELAPLSRAETAQRLGRRRLWIAVTAAAAILLLAVSLWRRRFSEGYPSARVEGQFSILTPAGDRVSSNTLKRGESLVAGANGARLAVGGYCQLKLAPNTRIVLGGQPYEEVVHLEVGKIVSHIESEKGKFRIKTVRGTLEVVGTEFTTVVEYPSSMKGGYEMNGLNRKLSAVVTVMVISGTVMYQFGDLRGHLGAGMSKVFAQPADRVQEGLVALFTFVAGEDGSIPDVSGAAEPLTLRYDPAPAEAAAEEQGLAANPPIPPPRVLRSDVPAAKIVDALSESNQMTLEVWLKPASLDQTGPARIVSLSAGTALDARNFTLGQSASSYAFRLRTAAADVEEGFRIVEPRTPGNVVLLERHQVVVTYSVCPHCGAGTFRLFVNGKPIVERSDIRGDFSTWDRELHLLIGNESTLDRPWRGTFYLVALYSRALSIDEVVANFLAGTGQAE